MRLEKIAYTFDSTVVGGGTQLMVGLMNPDGSGASALAVGDAPSWSPDGRRLVLTEVLCTYQLLATTTTHAPAGWSSSIPKWEAERRWPDSQRPLVPAWSPTGDLIAFTRCCESADRNRIYLVRPDGSLSGQLTIPQVVTAGDPGWSPDGKRIAFTCSSGNVERLVRDR